jgi:hypothetical protein
MTKPFDESLLSAYLDGELTGSERRLVDAHLRRSSEARQALKELGEVSALLRALPSELLPGQFPQRVLDAASRGVAGPERSVAPCHQTRHDLTTGPRRLRPRHSRRSVWWAGVGVAAAATVALTVVLSSPGSRSHKIADRSSKKPEAATRVDGTQLADAANEMDRDSAAGEAPALRAADPGPHPDVREHGARSDAMAARREVADELSKADPRAAALAAAPESPRVEPGEPKYVFFASDLKRLKPGQVADALVESGDEFQVVELTVVDVRKASEEVKGDGGTEVLFTGPLPAGVGGEEGEGWGSDSLQLVHVRSDATSFERSLERIRKKNPNLFLSLAVEREVPELVLNLMRSQEGPAAQEAVKQIEAKAEKRRQARKWENANHEMLSGDRANPRDRASLARRGARSASDGPLASKLAKDAPLNVFLLVREQPSDVEPAGDAPAPLNRPAEPAKPAPGKSPSRP